MKTNPLTIVIDFNEIHEGPNWPKAEPTALLMDRRHRLFLGRVQFPGKIGRDGVPTENAIAERAVNLREALAWFAEQAPYSTFGWNGDAAELCGMAAKALAR